MKLNQKLVDAIGTKPDRVIWDDDAPGLGLRVQSGKRTWIVRYRVARSQRQKSASGDLSLKKARAWAADIRTGAGKGADIIAEGRAAAEAAKREAETAKARSLGKIIEKYLLDAGKRLRPASYKVAKLYLTGTRYWQQLADRPADALGRREILAVLEPWNGKVTAAQMLYHLSACLTWGVERSLLERNCATGIKPPVQKVDRERVLTDAEIRQLWAATEPTGADTVEDRYAMILRLLLLTGQRRGEVGGVRRAELDPERQVWHLPGERTKNGLPHDVPLSRQVTALLQAPELTGTDHLFGEGGFNAWWRSKQHLDARLAQRRAEGRLGGPLAEGEKPAPEDAPQPWTVHDLRRTVVTGMAEIGIAPHIVEAVVNHISGHKGGVAGVYNRATYSKEKRAALQKWADHVESTVAGKPAANVVAFG